MFEWDEEKNQKNIAKHGISFNEAKEIFKGLALTTVDNRQNYGEIRYISIGEIFDTIIVLVAHRERNNKIRIISARIANKKEREGYYGYIKKKNS
jgi:uncharacterized protein